MADTVTKAKRSQIMGNIKNKDSSIEVQFRKMLWKDGLRYRKNSNKYFGKPDLVFEKYNTVIFIDSCFWHGCKKHCRMPNTNKSYWQGKIRRNIDRDIEVNLYYRKNKWKTLRIWEHQLNNEKKIITRMRLLLEH